MEVAEPAIGLNKSATMRCEKAVSSQIGSRNGTLIESEWESTKRNSKLWKKRDGNGNGEGKGKGKREGRQTLNLNKYFASV